MAHYYTDNRSLPSDRKEFSYCFDNENFVFVTDIGVFSKGSIDYGTYLLMKAVYRRDLGQKILDLGCGYGPVGIILKRFFPQCDCTMVDVNHRALELAQINCERNSTPNQVSFSDDITALHNTFDSIILNPPIRAGKVVVYDLYQKSHDVLRENGSLYIVVQKKQGADSHKKKLEELFRNVDILDKDGGYVVIQADR